jgi:hypothetical protein
MIDVVLDVSGIYGLGPSNEAIVAAERVNLHDASASTRMGSLTTNNNFESLGSQAASVNTHSHDAVPEALQQVDVVDPNSGYDFESASVIRLSNGMVLYLKEVDTMLGLVCITRSENFRKTALINYNLSCLKSALRALTPKPDGKK